MLFIIWKKESVLVIRSINYWLITSHAVSIISGLDTKAVPVGWRYGAEEDSVGKVGVGVSTKGERRNWNQGP